MTGRKGKEVKRPKEKSGYKMKAFSSRVDGVDVEGAVWSVVGRKVRMAGPGGS
jgi:hypothetical protein